MNFLSCINDIDYSIANFVNNFLHSTNGALTPFLKFITILGNGGAVFILATLCLLFFKKTRKAGLISAFSLILGLIVTNLLLKNIIARTRPFIDESSVYYIWWKQAGSLSQSGFSFPSGHTTAAMAFAFSLFLCFNKKTSWLYLSIPLVMGFTRIYFMVHYASDVFGAIIVGGLCSTISFFIVKAMEKSPHIQKFLSLPSITSVFKSKTKTE